MVEAGDTQWRDGEKERQSRGRKVGESDSESRPMDVMSKSVVVPCAKSVYLNVKDGDETQR